MLAKEQEEERLLVLEEVGYFGEEAGADPGEITMLEWFLPQQGPVEKATPPHNSSVLELQ